MVHPPGVAGILVSGSAAAIQARYPILGTGWILWPIVLFSLSGIAFGMGVAPLQRRIVTLARAGSGNAWGAYAAMYRRWELWGLVALITPFAAAAIMVLRPGLPAL